MNKPNSRRVGGLAIKTTSPFIPLANPIPIPNPNPLHHVHVHRPLLGDALHAYPGPEVAEVARERTKHAVRGWVLARVSPLLVPDDNARLAARQRRDACRKGGVAGLCVERVEAVARNDEVRAPDQRVNRPVYMEAIRTISTITAMLGLCSHCDVNSHAPHYTRNVTRLPPLKNMCM
jgi:hypothetical protein